MINHWGVWGPLAHVVAALIPIVLILHLVAVGALVFIWMERKVSGRIQDRLGPTRVGGAFGWLQTLADGIKLIAKEDITPKDADRLLFKLAPYVSFTASFASWLALPFATGWVAQHLSSGVFIVIAILGLEVFGVILAGYASGSKWSLFGAMREAAQVVSYEVPLGLCVVIPVFICGTMDLVTIGDMQAGFATNWLLFHDPFTFVVFWVYFTCGVASVNRAPFDLAEAESELVAGFHTEYSGLRWSFFFMAEYGSMLLVSCLAAILFLGGWHGPIPVTGLVHWLCVDTWHMSPGGWAPFFQYLANLLGCTNLILKGVIGVTVMMWIRWTLPRLRIDQVMTTCLKYCVPIASVCFLGAVAWQTLGLHRSVFAPNNWVPAIAPALQRPRWEIREEVGRPGDAAGEMATASDGRRAEVAMRERGSSKSPAPGIGPERAAGLESVPARGGSGSESPAAGRDVP